jgi:hypothetical protein
MATVTKFTVRQRATGQLIDRARIVNAPDLADKRIKTALRHYPDAVVERTDRHNVNLDLERD